MLNGTSKVLASFEKSNSRLQGQQVSNASSACHAFPVKHPR